MLTRLPSETIAQIIEYLPSKEDARSVALVCSALRPHAYRRLFRSFRVSVERGNIIPFQAELVLSYQHLLQYTSRLLIWRSAFASRSIYPPEHGEVPGTPLHYLWPHLTNMPRLTCIRLNLESGGYPAALSALERLDPARSITLYIADRIGRGIPMSENSLPVQLLSLHLDGLSHQMGNQLVRKCSQSLFELRLILYRALIPDLPFCPHLRKVFISFSVLTGTHDRDLTPWLSTFAQYPSLTSVSLGPTFTSVNTVHPSLLPNLQSLSAHPVIVERLVPGRPVHTVDVTAPFRFKKQSSSYSTVLQSLALSCVPVTTLDITIDAILSTEILVNMIRSLPMLRILQLSTGYQVCCPWKGGSLNTDFNSFHLPLKSFCMPLGGVHVFKTSDLGSPKLVEALLTRAKPPGRETTLCA